MKQVQRNTLFVNRKGGLPRPNSKVLKKIEPLKKLSLEFAHLTTCHGFRQIAAPKRKLTYRLIWATVVFGLFCGLAKELFDKLIEYTAYEIVTDLHEEHARELDFPAVTICNTNRFETTFDELEFAKINSLIQASYFHQEKDEDKWWAEAIQAFHHELQGLGKETYFLREEFILHGWKLNDTTLRHCSFEKEKCTIKNFTQIVTPMGLCYTFVASKGHNGKQRVAGSGHGLELYIDINQYEYTKNETNNIRAGVKIIIHEPGDPPVVEKFGHSVSNGHTAHIALKKTKNYLMFQPWGICEPTHKELKYHEHYTVASCMDECHVEFVINSCQCKPYWDTNYNISECDAWNILNCAGKAEVEFPLTNTEKSCGCGLPCEYVAYETVSASIFPTIEVGEFLNLHAYQTESTVKLDQIDYSFNQLRSSGRDHVMLDVFYDELSYTSLTQRKSISGVSLMGDIGGLLGLWLGISLITIAEFVQFGVDCFELSMGWKKGFRKKDIVDPPTVQFGVVSGKKIKFGVIANEEDVKRDEDDQEEICHVEQVNLKDMKAFDFSQF